MCQNDKCYMCIGTDCETKSSFLIQMYILPSIVTVYRTLHWLSNHNRIHTCIVTCLFVFIKQDTVRLYNYTWHLTGVADRSRASIYLSPSGSAGVTLKIDPNEK